MNPPEKYLREKNVMVWAGLNWLRMWSNGDFCERSNKGLGSIKE